MDTSDRNLIRGGGICGIVGTVTYIGLAAAYSGSQGGPAEFLREAGLHPHSTLVHFALAGAVVLWMVAFLGLGRLLEQTRLRNAARLGTVFGVVACGLLVAMVIVQASVMFKMGSMFVAAQNDTQRELLTTVYRALRSVDQGMDLAFDMFFFTAWICFAIAMVREPRFGKVLGGLIVALFAIDTPIQLWYAPTPPPVDLGPFGSLLFLVVYVQMIRAVGRPASSVQPKPPAAAAACQ